MIGVASGSSRKSGGDGVGRIPGGAGRGAFDLSAGARGGLRGGGDRGVPVAAWRELMICTV